MPPGQGIAVPSARTMQTAFGEYGYGFMGGMAFGGVRAILGSGILGSLIAPVLAGSLIKGIPGTVIATLAGFNAGAELLSGGLGNLFGGGAPQEQVI